MALFRRPSNAARLGEMAARLGADLESALETELLQPHELRYAATRCGECRSLDLCAPLLAAPASGDAPRLQEAPDFCPNRLLYQRLARSRQ